MKTRMSWNLLKLQKVNVSNLFYDDKRMRERILKWQTHERERLLKQLAMQTYSPPGEGGGEREREGWRERGEDMCFDREETGWEGIGITFHNRCSLQPDYLSALLLGLSQTFSSFPFCSACYYPWCITFKCLSLATALHTWMLACGEDFKQKQDERPHHIIIWPHRFIIGLRGRLWSWQ